MQTEHRKFQATMWRLKGMSICKLKVVIETVLPITIVCTAQACEKKHIHGMKQLHGQCQYGWNVIFGTSELSGKQIRTKTLCVCVMELAKYACIKPDYLYSLIICDSVLYLASVLLLSPVESSLLLKCRIIRCGGYFIFL